eukprot:s2033_g3.t1
MNSLSPGLALQWVAEDRHGRPKLAHLKGTAVPPKLWTDEFMADALTLEKKKVFSLLPRLTMVRLPSDSTSLADDGPVPKGRGRGRGRNTAAARGRARGRGDAGATVTAAPEATAVGTLPEEPCVKTQGHSTAAPMPPPPRLPARPLPPATAPSGPSLAPTGLSVAAPGPAAAGLMNLMFADDSQDVSRDAPKPKRPAEEVFKPELDTETAPVNNDAPEAPIKLDLNPSSEKLALDLDPPALDPPPDADTLPGGLDEGELEPFGVEMAQPVADGPVLQTVSFYDMLKGLD